MGSKFIGGTFLLIALAHLIWPARVASINNRMSLLKAPFNTFNTRALGVLWLLAGLFALFV